MRLIGTAARHVQSIDRFEATPGHLPSKCVDASTTSERPTLPVARNTALLLAPVPAVVLAAGALAAIPAGRSMGRFGRVPVLAAGSAGRPSPPWGVGAGDRAWCWRSCLVCGSGSRLRKETIVR